MKWTRIRALLIHLLAAVCGYIPFFGLHPFSVAYLAAAMMETPYRFSLLPPALLGLLAGASDAQLLQYGIVMLLLLIANWILESKYQIQVKWCTCLLAGASVFIAGLCSRSIFVLSLAEGVLVSALSVIFTFLPFQMELKSFGDPANMPQDAGKTRLCESAEVFSRLSKCFSELPYQKSRFSKDDLERMSGNLYHDFCIRCSKAEECWKKNYLDTAATCETLFGYMEQGNSLTTSMVKGRLRSQCIKLYGFLNAMTDVFDQARIHLFWYNRLIEHREAVANQLDEMANMMTVVAEEVYESDHVDAAFEDKLRKALREMHVRLEKVSVLYSKKGRYEVFLNMAVHGVRYVQTKEIAKALSRLLGVRMTPAQYAKTICTDTPASVLFIEEPQYAVICKSARVIKPGQSVSGDNYMFLETDEGQAFICLSDGMGSGVSASHESETVIDLMERFIEAGFSKETAVKMINSTMVLTDGEPACSTVDICSIDLYDGKCDFIKLGAAASFLKREHTVERITASSIPAGVLQSPEYETTDMTVTDGDFIIMVSDGLTDLGYSTDALENLIKAQDSPNPMEIANNILAGALRNCGYNPQDDMTVLVLGIWKK